MIMLLFNAGMSSICIVSLVWDKSVIIYGVWKEWDEIILAAFEVTQLLYQLLHIYIKFIKFTH